MLIGATVVPLAACANDSEAPPPVTHAAGHTLTAAADVPVGKAKIVDGTLITQPTPGVFRGFAARCTHAGCALAVTNGGIECPCHGSKFTLDGTVARGPATEPLAPRPVQLQGESIVTS